MEKFSLEKLRAHDWSEHEPDLTFTDWEVMTDQEVEEYLKREGLNPNEFRL